MKNKTLILNILLLNLLFLAYYTISLMFCGNPLQTNFSDLANNSNYQVMIMIWSLWTSMTFGFLLFKLKKSLKTWMIISIIVLLNCACLCPYNPQASFVLSQLHIVLAYISFSCLTFGIVAECIEYQKIDVMLGKTMLNLVVILLSLLGLLMMIIGGVTSLFETIYTIVMQSILILFIYLKEKK